MTAGQVVVPFISRREIKVLVSTYKYVLAVTKKDLTENMLILKSTLIVLY